MTPFNKINSKKNMYRENLNMYTITRYYCLFLLQNW